MVLAVIGTALPVVPTVPFLLVAVWAFARSSPRLARRILRNRTYGPPIRAWQRKGVIARWVKIWAVAAMAVGVVFSLFVGLPVWLVTGQFLICSAVATFIVTRPEI